jgi:N-acetylmuramoyl-L-alanine amidase
MLFLASLLLASPSFADGGLPQHRLVDWDASLVSPEVGTRFAAIVEAVDEKPVQVEVFDGFTWREAVEVFRIRNRSLIQTDLYEAVNTVLIRSPDQDRILSMDWDLVVPLNEYRGPPQPPTPGVLPQEIKDLGVISRADWGARATTCVSTEDDWYRMAIHHTAGNLEQNGSVQEQVQWLQVFFQETRGYCDIAYQFLVGWDGSLWEGRPYDYYSAATGGGNNNGNAAISFMGCYDSVACIDVAGPHTPAQYMLNKVHELVYTLSQIEDIPTDSDHIKGHNDWPGNNTACPGDRIEAHISDWFVPPGPEFSASLVDNSFPLSDEAPIVLKLGETVSGYLAFENTGRSSWDSNTLLAPLPKDEASPVYGEDWADPSRVTASDEHPAPGEDGTFSFSLTGREPGVYYQEFSLLQENETWFDGDGGVNPTEIVLRIVVSDEEEIPGTDTADFTRTPVSELGGCACTSTPNRGGVFSGLLALMGALLIRRRR